MPMFTGEMPHYRLYEFTPDEEHDPDQRVLALPRVLFVLDDFPVNQGQAMLLVRDPGTKRWKGLSEQAVRALAVVSVRLVDHMEGVLIEAKSVSTVRSETSIPEPHELYVPIHERGDLGKLEQRTYTDETREPADKLAAAQSRLALPPALREDLNGLLAGVYWTTQPQ